MIIIHLTLCNIKSNHNIYTKQEPDILIVLTHGAIAHRIVLRDMMPQEMCWVKAASAFMTMVLIHDISIATWLQKTEFIFTENTTIIFCKHITQESRSPRTQDISIQSSEMWVINIQGQLT